MYGLTECDDVETTAVGERILATASELFYFRGITATGVELIAEKASTTKRTLYQRFTSKEGLVSAYLRRRAHLWQLQLKRELAELPSRTREAALEVVFDAAIRRAASAERGCAFVNAWAELGGSDRDGAGIIQEEKHWMADLFTAIAEDEDVGQAIHILYEGAQVRSTILGDDTALDRAYALAHQTMVSQAA